MEDKIFDVIIVGGSYAGLSAAMALGRALRKVLILDSGAPCNRRTPYSHNFITQDGVPPEAIAAKAREQVLAYPTVTFLEGTAVAGRKTESGFDLITQTGETFAAGKLVFASGVKDLLPDIPGFSACWGISVLHCPYCHGYEVKQARTGVLANGKEAFHYVRLIRNWTKDLALFTHGRSALTPDEAGLIEKHGIPIIEKEIASLEQEEGRIRQIVFRDGSAFALEAIYFRPPFEQHCVIPQNLGCALNESGWLKTDSTQQTTVNGVYACGDCAGPRAIAIAVSTGLIAGSALNNKLTEEAFSSRADSA